MMPLEKEEQSVLLLLEKFETNQRMVESAVFQDESDFPLQIPINSQSDHIHFKDQKKDVLDKNLSHEINRQPVKVMVTAALTWFGVTKPLFDNKKGFKVNAEDYLKNLKKEYFLSLIRSIHEKIGFSFKMVQRPIPVILFKIF